MLLQELKCQTAAFPREAIEGLGYNLAIHGQKTYNGVAILSKYSIDEFNTNLSNDPDSLQSRYIEACISTRNAHLRVVSVYVPNGQEIDSEKFAYKLQFLDALKIHLQKLLTYDEATIIGGDFNVAPEDIDVYNAKKLENCICFSQIERQKLQQLLHLGFSDSYRLLNKNKQEFSWWDYRARSWQYNFGMRIDHILLSPEASDLLVKAAIEEKIRGQNKASDHVPVTIELSL